MIIGGHGGAVIEALPPKKLKHALTTNRSSRYRFELLDSSGAKFGDLDGVSSGTVEFNAEAQVQGGGKITVSKANAVHKKQIRVAKNLPIEDEVDFEIDTEGFVSNWEFSTTYEDPKSITRSTSTFLDGGAALDIEYKAPSAGKITQNVVRAFAVTPGVTYTFVAKVLNTSASNAWVKLSFVKNTPIAQKSDWQTVSLTFKATSTVCHYGIQNNSPANGQHIFMDNVVLYEGTTKNYNGEHFEYAPFNWMHARVRPVLEIDGMPDEPLGVFIPTAPLEQWDEGGGRQEIELLDRTSIINQDNVPRTYTVKKGANIVNEVRKLIRSTGEKPGPLKASGETLGASMTWGAGTNKLTIINELLDAGGFVPLWADNVGQYRVQKYRPPAERRVAYTLLDNSDSIYIPTLSIDRDPYSVPNRVVMTAQGDGESEAWTATAVNRNEKSPFSFQRRGRWITDTQLGVEATSQANLQEKAERRLRSLSSASMTVDIQHAPIPLRPNNVLRFRRTPADVDTLFTVSKTSIDFNPMALAKTTLTEVVAI